MHRTEGEGIDLGVSVFIVPNQSTWSLHFLDLKFTRLLIEWFPELKLSRGSQTQKNKKRTKTVPIFLVFNAKARFSFFKKDS